MHRVSITLAAIIAAAAFSAPAGAASISATTTVNVAKPVQLTKLQDMDFGTVILSGFSGTRTVAISQAGALTCGANLICQGVPKAARFNVQGFNKMTATIAVTGGNLSNGTETILFTPDAPVSVYLPNSGAPGIDFAVGGTITLSSTLAGGTYTGTMTVTSDYQ
jgi:hypothetical protein